MRRLRQWLGNPWARWATIVVVSACLVVVGVVVGWRLAGATKAETDLGRVSMDIVPSLRGEATAYVPLADWGFRADAFDAPFEIKAELRSLDRAALGEAAGGDLSVLSATEAALESGARDAALRALLWGLGVSLLLLVAATLIWRGLRPRWALLAVGGSMALLGLGATAASAVLTFDAAAFQSPTYFARGAELRRILEVASDEQVRSRYGSDFTSILRSVGAVLSEGGDVAPDTREIYLASDLHGNPLVVRPISDSVGNAPLLLAGDFGQRGSEAESALIAPRAAALSDEVIAVAGNHDSAGIMEALSEQGVTVLGESGGPDITEVEGLKVAGYADPLEWRGEGDPVDRPVTFGDLPDPEAAFEGAADDLERWFEELPRPDLVMVHQNELAQELAARLFEQGRQAPLTIVTGHDHEPHVDRYGDVVVVDGGSVGANGPYDAGREPIGLAGMHFPTESAALRSVDLIAIEPFSGQAQASRVVIDALCSGSARCTVEPGSLEGEAPPD